MHTPSESTAASEGLKLIGAGFGRTGTSSLQSALETLGYGPCYHMFEVTTHDEYPILWNNILNGAPPDWPRVFAGYHATVDWPACTYYEQLMRFYPEAKVLLSVRDPDRWYDSVHETIYSTRELARSIEERGITGQPQTPGEVRALWSTELIWKQTFDDRFEDRDHTIAVFLRHNDEVKEKVPANRLLVYEVSQGWEPLCEFLGVEVPQDQPFPHTNDRAGFVARRAEIMALFSGQFPPGELSGPPSGN